MKLFVKLPFIELNSAVRCVTCLLKSRHLFCNRIRGRFCLIPQAYRHGSKLGIRCASVALRFTGSRHVLHATWELRKGVTIAVARTMLLLPCYSFVPVLRASASR